MAGARDLLEANSYRRDRLVAAFVWGDPGGREGAPTRPGRTVLGGLVLAAALLGGAAATGLPATGETDDWSRPGLVVSDETGASYLILEESNHPTLHPVLDSTSARLAVEDGDVRPRIVAQETIDQQVIGATVGIPDAPATLPTPPRLVQTGWSACAGDGRRLRVRLSGSPGVRRVPGAGILVESRGVHYVVARAEPEGATAPTAHAYRVPGGRRHPEGDEQDTLLDRLGLPIRREATHVPGRWLALFPAGGELAWRSFGLTGLGRRAPGAGSLGLPASARVGDVLTTGDGSFLLTRHGPAELTDFALTVYRHVPTPRGRLADGPSREEGGPLELTVDEAPSVGRASQPYRAARWPASGLGSLPGPPCAALTARVGSAPTVRLATEFAPDAAGGAGVAAGRGAYVRSGSWGGEGAGPPVVVDATGRAYPLVGPGAAERLGYGDTAAPVVPGSWLDLFERGVPLSVEAALSRVRRADGS